MNTTTQNFGFDQASAAQNIARTLSGLRDGATQATASVQQAQSAMQQGAEKAMKAATEMFSFAQGNAEALTHCRKVLATGMQDMTQAFTAAAKASAEDTVHAFKALGSVKSVKEAMDLQAALLRSTMEKAVSHASQMTDASVKLSEQAFAPLAARMSLAAETFGRAR